MHLISRRKADGRNRLMGKAIRPSTLYTGEMYMTVMMLIFATTKTILALPHAIIQLVQQVVLREKTQSTEDATPIHLRQPSLHIFQSESPLLGTQLPPHQNAYRRGLYTAFQKHLFNMLTLTHLYLIINNRGKGSKFTISLQKNA